jgi:hypothetical protein
MEHFHLGGLKIAQNRCMCRIISNQQTGFPIQQDKLEALIKMKLVKLNKFILNIKFINI